MGLGKRHRPAQVHSIPDSLDGVAEFIGKEKVTRTAVFSFEGADITNLCVHTKNSVCSIILPHRPHTHLEAIKSMGWPSPEGLMCRDLPRAAGLLYERHWPTPPEATADTEEPEDEPVAPVRVRRTRIAAAPAAPVQGVARVRRTRTQAA